MLHQFSGLHLQYKSLVSYIPTITYNGNHLQLAFPKAELIKSLIRISFAEKKKRKKSEILLMSVFLY